MFKDISWSIFLKVNSELKAEQMIRKFGKTIGSEVTTISCEKYWKDDSLYRVRLTSPLNIDDFAQAIFVTLTTCGRLAHQWEITAPSISENKQGRFTGLTDKTSFVGTVFIEFEIANYQLESNEV